MTPGLWLTKNSLSKSFQSVIQYLLISFTESSFALQWVKLSVLLSLSNRNLNKTFIWPSASHKVQTFS